MRYVTICIGILFYLLFQQDIGAETLYTWIAPEGTIHISKAKPPQNVILKERLRFPSRSLAARAPRAEAPTPGAIADDTVLAAMRQAKTARQKAQAARRAAETAIEKANRLKRETEAFLEPWRDKKRIRKPMQLKIEGRIKETNQVIAEAERLIAAANEAEQKAQSAESNARNMQARFLEAYQKIVSK